MPSKALFAQITKVDVANRTVTGIAMQEVVDRTLEKCLYEESKPYFQEWSDTQAKASGGKSKGNVREMHTNSAVGVVTDLTCDDAQKAFVITTEVVDDVAWKKVEKGVYTGFSIGANFAKDASGKSRKKMVDGILEWVAVPVEVSLVDVPCVPTATFDLQKADGTHEQRKFGTGETQKSMYTVSQLASTLQDIQWMVADLQWESEWENDDSKIPDRLLDWMKEGAGIFLDLAQEETSEFAAMLTSQKAARADRQKAGACVCDCAACADCAQKKALQTNQEQEMTPEQTKAFTDAAEQMKAAAAKMEGVVADVASIKTTTEQTKNAVDQTKTAVDGLETRLKAVEDANKELDDFMTKLGEEPVAAKTQHPAVAVPREAEEKKGLAAVVADGEHLTDSQADRAKRLKALTASRAENASTGAGFPA